ncbi:MAG TPA: family 1 glycosylhydrolase [Solirubrobacteraceae bacterium]|nr:family 1 glycosylhydrolase [Solirubrobacteraceae bacterium]
MAGRLRPSVLVVACLASLCTAASLPTSGAAALVRGVRRPASAASSPAPLGGVNITGVSGGLPLTLADREVRRAATLHAKLVRVEVQWSAIEPDGKDQIDPAALAYLDRLVSDAAASGIRVIATADSSPCWASSAPSALLRRCVPGGWTRANAWPPREPSAYAAFVAYLAARYGTRLAAIEVWNEPDQANEDYFAGPEKPQRYAAVLRAAYPAIKQAAPEVKVLAGSLVGSNGVFLRALYAAGIKGYYDGLAVHFYTLTLGSLRAIHETQLANGDNTPLWLDEFGWSSCWPRQRTQQEQGCVTPKVQAANIANLYRSLAHTPYVAAAALYKLQDSAGEDFGVMNAKGTRKPAFGAFAQVLASPFGSPTHVTLSLRRQHGGVLASGEGPVGDYIQLEAFQGATLRYKALFTLDRFNRYAIPLPRALGTHGLMVRVYQYWQGSSRDAQRSI